MKADSEGDPLVDPWDGWPPRPSGMAVAYAGAAALALVSPGLARRFRRVLPAPLADLAVTGGLTVIGWAMLAVLEQVAPHRVEWNVPDDEACTDLAYLGVLLVPTAVGSNALAGALAGGIQRSLGTRSGHATEEQPLPLALGVVRALLVTELVHYWQHRTARRVGLLWRAHQVHHSEKRMYWVNGTRFHPLDEVPLVTMQGVVLRLARVDPDALLVHNVFKLIHGLLQHANIDGSCRGLQPVVSTPAQHRLHHAAAAGDEGVSFGAVLSVWDRAFGTAQAPTEPPSRTTQIGLLDAPDFPGGFADQLAHPFRGDRPAWSRRPGAPRSVPPVPDQLVGDARLAEGDVAVVVIEPVVGLVPPLVPAALVDRDDDEVHGLDPVCRSPLPGGSQVPTPATATSAGVDQ